MFSRYMWCYTISVLKPLMGPTQKAKVFDFQWTFLQKIPTDQAAPAMDDDEALALVSASARAHRIYNSFQQRQSNRRTAPPSADQVKSELDSFSM